MTSAECGLIEFVCKSTVCVQMGRLLELSVVLVLEGLEFYLSELEIHCVWDRAVYF